MTINSTDTDPYQILVCDANYHFLNRVWNSIAYWLTLHLAAKLADISWAEGEVNMYGIQRDFIATSVENLL